MAARKVQSYLDQHRIGPLFEDLMAKLIKDMPNQPIPYLVKALRKISPEDDTKGYGRPPSGSRSMSPGMSKTIGLTGTPIARQSLDDSKDIKRSALAKSWAAPDAYSDPYKDQTKMREYERPWLTGSKLNKSAADNKRPASKTKKSADAESWNPDTRVPTHDFDELFQYRNGPAKGADTPVEYDGPQSWNDSDLHDVPIDKRGLGYPLHIKRAPQPVVIATDDGLEGEELKLRNDVRTVGDSSDSGSVSSYGSGRSYKSLNARSAAEEHRQQLQALLMKTSDAQYLYHTGQRVSGDDTADDGTEVLENANELESEGAGGITTSGAKLSKAGMSNSEPVKVSICARCARVITGLPADQRSDAGSTFSTTTVDDDNFESVSQVGSTTGDPPRVTWPAGFDTGSEATPRKGQHMWQSSSPKPEKGKHMYRASSFPSGSQTHPRPMSSASERSEDGPGPSGRRKYSGYSSDDETDTYRVPSPVLADSRPWTRPPADSTSEADSGTWAQDRKKVVAFKSKGFRRYQGNLSDSDN